MAKTVYEDRVSSAWQLVHIDGIPVRTVAKKLKVSVDDVLAMLEARKRAQANASSRRLFLDSHQGTIQLGRRVRAN